MRKNTNATVYLRNGQTKEVTHSQGSIINAILLKEREPADDAQAEFMKDVKRVVFRNVVVESKMRKPAERKRTPVDDAAIKKIINNKKLSGIEKARAVNEYIKKR